MPITLRLSPYIIKKPFPKQAAFMCLDKYERVLYGGAAGGGKTLALLMAALQYFDVRGYAAILFRKSRVDMDQPGGLMALAREWLQGRAHWNGREWRSPEGATLTFGYVSTDADLEKYQGGEYHFIGVDEATQLTQFQHEFLASRNRKSISLEVPLRLRYASNPGGPSHNYFKRNFMDEPVKGYLYLPAVIDDNPNLDKEDYVTKKLAYLDPVTRARFLEGDWNVRESGNLFHAVWFNDKLVPLSPTHLLRVRFFDLAASEQKDHSDPDFTSSCLMGIEMQSKRIYIEHMQRARYNPYDVEQLVRLTANIDKQKYGYVETRIEQEGAASGKIVIDHYTRNVLFGFPFQGSLARSNKIERAAPFSSYCQAGNVYLVQGDWNREFLDELQIFPEGSHDDMVDSASGAFAELCKYVQLFPSMRANAEYASISASIQSASDLNIARNRIGTRSITGRFGRNTTRSIVKIKRQVGY